jgi:hypothetical protein
MLRGLHESDKEKATRAANKAQATKLGALPPKTSGKPWPYEIEQSGWYMSHEALRADLSDTVLVLKRMIAAPALEDWEIPGLRSWWTHIDDFVHEHHRRVCAARAWCACSCVRTALIPPLCARLCHACTPSFRPIFRLEEDWYFPYISQRAELPQRLAADHKHLESLLVVAEAAIGACTQQAGLPYVLAAVQAITDHMLPHLREEEQDVMPVLHERFEYGEYDKFFGKVAGKAFDWFALPHMQRPIPRNQRRHHAVEILGIPGFAFDYLMAKNYRRFDTEYESLIEELKEPSKRKGEVTLTRKGICA